MELEPFVFRQEGRVVGLRAAAASRDSMHLAKYGGIAVDLVAVVASSRHRVPQSTLGDVCRRYFDFVKDDYRDGHVHADLRGHF